MNILFLVSITPENIYSRFISFGIICFTLNSSSNKKNQQKKQKKKKKKDTKRDFCRTKASDYGDLHHQGVTEKELDILSCLACYLSDMCENW